MLEPGPEADARAERCRRFWLAACARTLNEAPGICAYQLVLMSNDVPPPDYDHQEWIDMRALDFTGAELRSVGLTDLWPDGATKIGGQPVGRPPRQRRRRGVSVVHRGPR
jgi:hypothetical protein